MTARSQIQAITIITAINPSDPYGKGDNLSEGLPNPDEMIRKLGKMPHKW